MIELKRLRQSFKHALRGVRIVFKTEQSFRIQTVVGILVIIAAFWLEIRAAELIILFLMVGVVLVLELINSIFERIIDTFKPRLHPAVRDIKDIMAGTVLIASAAAAVIGIIIFWPRIAGLF